jgi:hypothetical protein
MSGHAKGGGCNGRCAFDTYRVPPVPPPKKRDAAPTTKVFLAKLLFAAAIVVGLLTAIFAIGMLPSEDASIKFYW